MMVTGSAKMSSMSFRILAEIVSKPLAFLSQGLEMTFHILHIVAPEILTEIKAY